MARKGSELEATQLWAEAREIPNTLRQTLAASDGFDQLAALLSAPEVRRVIATGNGAAYYAALALWLASLQSPTAAIPEVVAIPAGLLTHGRFVWKPGDRLLVISSSGELRDVIEAFTNGVPHPFGTITSTPSSTIASQASAVARVQVAAQEVPTHTQAFCGNVVAVLSLWARLSRDATLADALASAPSLVESAIAKAAEWAPDAGYQAGTPTAAVCFGSGPGWTAALEAALLLKEVSGVPAEGLESREGATSGMYPLGPDHLVLALHSGGASGMLDEAQEVCARSGATVIRTPNSGTGDDRLAPLTTFPAALALAIAIGLQRGVDVDHPAWLDAYYSTARVAESNGTKAAKG